MKPTRPGDGLDIPDQDPRYVVQVWHDTRPDVPDFGNGYVHCAECLKEWREHYSAILSPKAYARQQVAVTGDGMQVWCTRHETNITALVFRAAVRKEEKDEPRRPKRSRATA